MIDTSSVAKGSSVSVPRKSEAMDEVKRAKLGKAVREFESVFVGYLLKTMRGTVPKSEVTGEGFGNDMLEGMFDMEMAKHISSNSGLGIGAMLYKQMTGEPLPAGLGHGAYDRAMKAVQPSIQGNPMGKPPQSPAGVRENGRMAPADTLRRRLGDINEVIQDAARQHSIDANLLKAVIATESGGRVDAASTKDAKGLMQLIDSTAADMGVKNVWDARENVQGGAKYLRQLLDRFDGDLTMALASYNAGPGAVEKHSGVPPYQETRDYLKKVMNYLHAFENEVDDE
jgi:Rod binding domain-containing protein